MVKSLPKALRKALKRMLPPGMKLDEDTEELLMETSTEFITLITSQAKEIRDRAGKDLEMEPEHVMKALEELNLADHKELQKLQGVRERVATVDQKRRDKRRDKKREKRRDKKRAGIVDGVTDEEALAKQQAQFGEAKASMKAETLLHNNQRVAQVVQGPVE